MAAVIVERCELTAWLHAACVRPEPGIAWLGQAGFVVRWGDVRLAIDPYLSDSLAAKYRGTPLPHVRLMPPPIAPDRLTGLQWVLCTHAHTDHMDPETLPQLAAANPACRFVVPRAETATALSRGVPADRLIALNAGEVAVCSANVSVRAVPAAHEELRTDADGNHHYLGYVLYLGEAAIYHAGDCVPYEGLAQELARSQIDLALVPVNGRDAWRRGQGISGNFTFAEAVAMCAACGIPAMLACHFGMFDFNTVDVAWLEEQMAHAAVSLECVRPQVDHVVWLAPRRLAGSHAGQIRERPAVRRQS